jgi:hypothetical protein
VIIASCAAVACVYAIVGQEIDRARLLVADGVISGLGIMAAATLLGTLELRTWKQILMFSLVLSLRISLKNLFVWEKTRVISDR